MAFILCSSVFAARSWTSCLSRARIRNRRLPLLASISSFAELPCPALLRITHDIEFVAQSGLGVERWCGVGFRRARSETPCFALALLAVLLELLMFTDCF